MSEREPAKRWRCQAMLAEGCDSIRGCKRWGVIAVGAHIYCRQHAPEWAKQRPEPAEVRP